MKINLLRPCVIGVSVCLGSVAFAPVVGAAPKSKVQAGRLEIWPGQRVLVVLPLIVSDDFMSAGNGAASSSAPSADVADVPVGPAPGPAPDDAPAPVNNPAPPSMTANGGGGGGAALADALKPLLAPELSSALQSTGKFSVIRPYKFDPLLTRAISESAGQGLTAEMANDFVGSPTLANAQDILGKLNLEQPGMVAQVVLQSLMVGGTQAAPTVQLSMRGDLYEAIPGATSPFRTITVTSRPFGGKTPEDRITAAATQAFSDIAAAFVAPPAEFQLPLPPASAGGMLTGTPTGGPTTLPAVPRPIPVPPAGTTTPSVPVAPVTPQTPNGTTGTPLVPQLPGSTPPLGVNVPDQN